MVKEEKYRKERKNMARKKENSREGRELQGETLKEQNIVRK